VPTVTVRDRLEPAQQVAVRTVADRVEARDGAPPLNDQALSRLGDAGPGLVHLLSEDTGEITGYAQLDGPEVTVVGSPAAIDSLLAAAEATATSTHLLLWSHGRRSAVAGIAETRGYENVRTLWQLRRSLSDIPDVAPPPGIGIRRFVPEHDEKAWLAVNAAAFAAHPDQGRWTVRDLAAREAEPWFDPAGFLLAERDDGLLGFHWTKLHPDGVGEVYVLGIDPAAQGMHLGPALLSAGLRYLAGRGARDVLLYVEDDNRKALALYEQFGFDRYDRDVQYRRVLTTPEQVLPAP
jgi:mycothiol synthase